MEVFRIETEDGTGFYRWHDAESGRIRVIEYVKCSNVLFDKNKREWNMNQSSRHPYPGDEFWNVPFHLRKDYFFDFLSEETLYKWFPRYICQQMYRNTPLKIWRYSVRPKNVVSLSTGRQCAFYRPTSKRLEPIIV